MIILKEFIWREDHYGYHITNLEAMNSICTYGLKPMIGDRSLSVGDKVKGIFFFDSLASIDDWIDALYKDKNIYELELLRFNIRNRKWFMHNPNEFYLTNRVPKDRIEYLRLVNPSSGDYLPLDSEKHGLRLSWNRLDNYVSLLNN